MIPRSDERLQEWFFPEPLFFIGTSMITSRPPVPEETRRFQIKIAGEEDTENTFVLDRILEE
ncbi:MAG: hypothetical protein ABF328_04750 [Akkermansiaceae bacterium]